MNGKTKKILKVSLIAVYIVLAVASPSITFCAVFYAALHESDPTKNLLYDGFHVLESESYRKSKVYARKEADSRYANGDFGAYAHVVLSQKRLDLSPYFLDYSSEEELFFSSTLQTLVKGEIAKDDLPAFGENVYVAVLAGTVRAAGSAPYYLSLKGIFAYDDRTAGLFGYWCVDEPGNPLEDFALTTGESNG